MSAWVWFAWVQAVMLAYRVGSLFWLIPPCLTHAWAVTGTTRKVWPPPNEALNGRAIDAWTWGWLHRLYQHNAEDGDSGRLALVWGETPGKIGYYMPEPAWVKHGWERWLYDAWRAYCWNQRNNSDGLKYYYAWAEAPPAVQKWGLLIGWRMENGVNVPVLERYP